MPKRKTTSCWSMAVIACLLFVAATHLRGAQAAAVMSVDLGSEWMKVGIVSPGVPMEIALNRESKRKTPVTLSFRNGVRSFGEDAVTDGIKEPASAYSYLLDLLGKQIDNPIVDLYRKRFPYYNIIADPERNTVIFKKSDTEEFSVEELIAQILVKAKEFAQEATNQPITECVITVPGYFGQAEREALLTSAQLANLKVLQLINDYTAVALNYGVFHPSGINETAQYYVFYDMGASHTSSAVVSYQLVKDKHTKETHPVVQVLGVGYDRTLGGLEIQLRLRDYLAAEFNALKKTTTDVTKSPKALAKLFKEAGRLKNVLSANNDHYAQIENLIEDQDFKLQVTREKLEEICSDLWPRVIKPLEQALSTSGLSLDVISQVILFGGGTRVPKVQETLKQYIKQELGKSLNADEAAAIGAVYKAADLATGFKVKKFIVKDAVLYPIQVTFERDPGEGAEVRQVKRVLFGLMNSYPQKKVITFNKHTEDFDFFVHYGDLNHLSAEEQSYVGSLKISRVELQKIKELLEKTKNESVDAKGIKAFFTLDDSALFRCTGVEYVYEKQKIETEEDDEGTLAKLGSTISKLFSKDKEEDKKEEGSQDGNENATEGEEATGGKDEEKSKEQEKNETKPTEGEAPKKNETIKIVTVKEPVAHSLTVQFTQPLSGKSYEKAAEKLNAINKAENLRNQLESSFNALESHIIDIQQKLEEEEYSSCATKEEKEKILAECSAASDWLYEDIENPTPEMYENKLKALKKLTDVFMARHWEHEERPEALKALSKMIEGAEGFLKSAKNLTKETNPEKDVFTQVEIDTLSKVISDTVEWQKTEVQAQDKLKRYENVRLTIKEITNKMSTLDREVKYLVTKINLWKPKVKPTKKDKKKAKKDGEEKKTEEGGEQEEGSSSGDGDAEKVTTEQSGDDTNKEEQVEIPVTEKKTEGEEEAEEKQEVPVATPTEDHTPRSDL
ncbi:hypoxia up-regulated protein 1 [Musca vetustissima]|uniref:hypoxia up-regulated protein 1 n=1 Tax=Musca vetustissima TaxID=27455 RepID=UPI002AB656A0|nr:hypoxia up-regulated protein 1 [Musca vetustissima]